MLNREIDFEKPVTDNTAASGKIKDEDHGSQAPIRVLVSNGDLKYASWPVLAGHFLNDGILFAEKAIDRYLDGELTKRHHLGLYPGDIGTCEIIIPNGTAKFKGSIIVGLGKQGLLTAYQLMQTVEQAVTKYLAGIISNSSSNGKKENPDKQYGISSLIIGCSYGGLTIENSIRAIIQGVFNSNNKIRHTFLEKARTISFIEFVEQYRDRALSCVYSLSRIEKDETRILDIETNSPRIKKLFGAKDRLPVDNSGEWWTRISVRVNYISNGDEKKKNGIRFTMTTDGAREEERFLYTDSETLDQMLEELSANDNWSPQLARTMFELLIPNDFKDQVKKQNNIIWILDKVTASYPWELLQDSVIMAKPISVNAGMIRQLATEDYRVKITPVIKPNAIIIADPDLKGTYPQLSGARAEGRAVKEILDANGYSVSLKEGSSASEIMLSVFSDAYKIVHLAAHGVFNPEPDKPRGMMIGPNAWFTSHEFHQMSTVPELVFVNCCYLGKSEGETEEYYRNRYKLAANIGIQLIENGVKAVIVTGWAVEDSAALLFTKVFYGNLFAGDNFGESVRKARKAVYDDYSCSNNTWGAYQCYGDPFFTLQGSQAQNYEKEYDFVIAQEAEIELSNLYNQLETGAYPYDSVGEIVKKIADAVDRQKLRNGRITELEALIYYELNIYEESMKKYASLLKEEKASFSFSAVEQYCNIRSKYYVNQILKQGRKPEDFSPDFDTVIDQLQGLAKLTETVERLNLLGSTWKRKAIISEGKKKLEAYQEAEKYYKKATEAAGELNRYYSMTNWRCIEKALSQVKPAGTKKSTEKPAGYDPASAIRLLRELMEQNSTRISQEMNYWDMVADANMKLALLILGDNDMSYQMVTESYINAWNEAGNPGQKEAELEQFHFLTDLFSMSENKEAKKILETIEQLKKELSS